MNGSSQWLCIRGGVNRPGEKLLKLGLVNASVGSCAAVHTRALEQIIVLNDNIMING